MKNKLPYAFYSCGFVFHTSWCSQRVCRVLATSVTDNTFGVLFREAFHQGILIFPTQWPWRLTKVLQVEDVLNHCHSQLWMSTPLVSFPLLCSWFFHLIFSNSLQSQGNTVWAKILCLAFCGDHLISIIHSLIYLPLTHMKSLNFTPTPMQWFSSPLSQTS